MSLSISDNVSGAQNARGLAEARQVPQGLPEGGNADNSQKDDSSDAYKISFTEEGWDALEGKEGRGGKEDDKESKDGKEGEKERDLSGREKLSDEDQKRADELKKIDQKVHVHEQAHLSAAGGYARGGANYDYTTGPDGKRYATSGHVNLETGPEKTPEETIRKASIISKAALAPADPSPADRQIAANAAKMAQEAQQQLAAERQAESASAPALPEQEPKDSKQPKEPEAPKAPQEPQEQNSKAN